MKTTVARVAPASIAWRNGVLFATHPSANTADAFGPVSIVTGGNAPGIAADARTAST
jgi:hypothetical protein